MLVTYLNLIPGHTADVVDAGTGEVLYTTASLTRRLLPGEARMVQRHDRRLHLVLSDEVLEVALMWAVRRRMSITHVVVFEVER
jgi:hypothetical protein